jgi:glycerol transport system permease protein
MKVARVVKVLFLFTAYLFFIFPLYWLISSSFKPTFEIWGKLTYFPMEIRLDNFVKVVSGLWGHALLNSIIVCSANVLICLLLGFLASYAFSRFTFAGDKHLYFWLLTNRMAPAAAFSIPFFGIYTGLGMWDTLPAVILTYTLFNLPLSIWILSGFFTGIPKELDEAAAIDGFRLLSFFRRVIIPLMRPGIGVTIFFLWTFSWTEMLLASVLTSSAAKTYTVQLMLVLAAMGFGIDWGAAAASGVISMIPALVALYWVRRYILAGFTFGRI